MVLTDWIVPWNFDGGDPIARADPVDRAVNAPHPDQTLHQLALARKVDETDSQQDGEQALPRQDQHQDSCEQQCHSEQVLQDHADQE